MKRDLGRQFLGKLKREGEARRGNMTDEEVERIVDNSIAESRNETRWPRSFGPELWFIG